MKHPTNLYINGEIWKNYKKFCIDQNKKASSNIEKFMKEEVQKADIHGNY